MQSKALKLNQDFDNLYNELILEMARRRIFLVNETQLDEIQLKWVKKYFHKEVLPHVTLSCCVMTLMSCSFKDEYAYIAVEMRSGDEFKYALIEIPTDQLPRFVMLPEQKGKRRKTIILLDNIIRLCLDEIFRGFTTTIHSTVTRWKWPAMPSTICATK